MPSTKITDDKLGTTLLDSDSDIEFVDEQRRPLRSPQCNQLQPEAIDLDDSVLDETVTESNYSPQYKLSNKAPDFKLPPLPLAPIRRSGLRSRNTNNAPVPQVLFTQKHPEKLKEFSIARSRTKLKPCSDNTSDIFSSDDEDEDFITPFLRTKARSKAANKFKVISDSDDSDSEKAPTAALGNKRTIKDVPISLEEELIGETHMSLSDDEDYQQDANGDLIEREAQCAVIDSDEWDSDGDLEKSFINDQTLCSQQLSQDTMHGLYLNSLVDRDGRGGMW
ncbi:hypothetical protein EB796_014575 [Bugula neritina]|uniref:Uncharacterized protein n=1 Tax=Bugula neritina TaxID=10212 RepID=A0A7J7JL87_BUGNE|nr:hypothetical protein EB796_014575 [Bugula neritina]